MTRGLTYLAATVPDPGGAGPAPIEGEWLRIHGAASVGWASDEAVVILAGSDREELSAAARAAGSRDARHLEATARPTAGPPAVPPGVVALRWFELAAAALLVTRYASLTVWEESRSVLRARTGSPGESGERFMRRRELTRRSVVRIGRPG